MKQQAEPVSVVWPQPVLVRIGYGSSEVVDGPGRAIEMLQHRWPSRRGLHYERAKNACILAAARNSSPHVAREEFIAAALEADVLAH